MSQSHPSGLEGWLRTPKGSMLSAFLLTAVLLSQIATALRLGDLGTQSWGTLPWTAFLFAEGVLFLFFVVVHITRALSMPPIGGRATAVIFCVSCIGFAICSLSALIAIVSGISHSHSGEAALLLFLGGALAAVTGFATRFLARRATSSGATPPPGPARPR